MKTRRERNKPDFFNIKPPEKKKKSDDSPPKAATAPQAQSLKRQRRITPSENLLVWGKFKGIGWWPGRIADRSELSGPLDPDDDPTRWVNWFGDHKYTETLVDNLASFLNFEEHFHRKRFYRSTKYATAVTEALQEAYKRSGRPFGTVEDAITWAVQCSPPSELSKDDARKDVDLAGSPICEVECAEDTDTRFIQGRNRALVHVRAGKLAIEAICLGCGDRKTKSEHPCFEGGLCADCLVDYVETMYTVDQDGNALYCCVCSEGKEVVYCDEGSCGRCFCTDCIMELTGIRSINQELKRKHWTCYLCRERSKHGLLKRRLHWRTSLQNLFAKCNDTVYASIVPAFPNVKKKKKIKVLSLFDGISVGMVVLKEMKFDVEVYYASEIDDSAIHIAQSHHPEIHHVGDVCAINNKELLEWGPFDLLIGGSPCNDLAVVNPLRKGLWSDMGSGKLFFEYFRILNACNVIAAAQHRPFFWLFENVAHMDRSTKEAITRFLQANPVILDAGIVSPARRLRMFWGNLPEMHRPLRPSPGDRLALQQCMENGRVAQTIKIGTITTNAVTISNKARQPKFPVANSSQEKKDCLWVTEVERIFGLPDHYTDKSNLSSTARRKVLGRTWSVPVIKHLLSPLRSQFLAKE